MSLATGKSSLWAIKKDHWSVEDEKNFEDFVYGIGKAHEDDICDTTEKCLNSPVANPKYASKNPPHFTIYSDCADLPYILRGYFAWMNDLPFSHPVDVERASFRDAKLDIRYTNFGNKIIKTSAVKTGDNIKRVLRETSDDVSSAMYRVHPDRDLEASAFTDFYSPVIARDSIKPGTVVYDPNGHVLVVYEVGDDGRIMMIDAHPDNSLTRQVYGEKFGRAYPSAGAGFKNWRPIQLVGATKDSVGNLIGGRVKAQPNFKIPDFSKEQYFGNVQTPVNEMDWESGKFIFETEEIPYYDFIRRTLSDGPLKYHPVAEVSDMLESLCDDLQDRNEAVNNAFKAGINKRSHPDKLPDNIFGTAGDWESFASPSRDARFKASAREIRRKIQDFYQKFLDGDPIIVYVGSAHTLIEDFKTAYEKQAVGCEIDYKNSNGNLVTLNLDQVIDRVYSLSFDPYHCIEYRWGATGKELASCKDDMSKRNWYLAEQGLRNIIDRNYDMKTNKSLPELSKSHLGIFSAPDINIQRYLNSFR
jgi:hypothetical protein